MGPVFSHKSRTIWGGREKGLETALKNNFYILLPTKPGPANHVLPLRAQNYIREAKPFFLWAFTFQEETRPID